jgi:hypothetical protein
LEAPLLEHGTSSGDKIASMNKDIPDFGRHPGETDHCPTANCSLMFFSPIQINQSIRNQLPARIRIVCVYCRRLRRGVRTVVFFMNVTASYWLTMNVSTPELLRSAGRR